MEEVIIDFKSNCHRPIMDQLKLPQGFIAVPREASHIVLLRGVVTEAVFLWFVWRIGAYVGKAHLFHQTKILGIFSCSEVREVTFTALSILAARDNLLKTHDWGLSIVGYYTVSCFQHIPRSKCVAASTKCLVLNRSNEIGTTIISPVPRCWQM